MDIIHSKPKFFGALTGLRGIGAFWVTVFHLFGDSSISIINQGFLGVDLFFILSGFILTHVHAKDFPFYSISAHIKFLKLRLARIYPLHVFVLLCFALFVFNTPDFPERYSNPERLDISHFFVALFLMNNWGFGLPTLWNGPTWSLSAEWLAYISFPFISIFCVKIFPSRWVLTGAFILIAIMEFVMLWKGIHGGLGKAGLLRMAAEFTAGCLLYRHTTLQSSKKYEIIYLSLAITILFFALHIPAMLSFASAGFGLLILSVSGKPNLASRLLSSKPLIWLGEISFSLYLCHWPLIQIRNWATPKFGIPENLSLALLLFFILITSVFSYNYIEKPARVYGKKLIELQ